MKKKIGILNVSHKTQYYLSESKKMRCDIQDRGNYQPCRMFIENSVAKDITMNSVKAKVAISRSKL